MTLCDGETAVLGHLFFFGEKTLAETKSAASALVGYNKVPQYRVLVGYNKVCGERSCWDQMINLRHAKKQHLGMSRRRHRSASLALRSLRRGACEASVPENAMLRCFALHPARRRLRTARPAEPERKGCKRLGGLDLQESHSRPRVSRPAGQAYWET